MYMYMHTYMRAMYAHIHTRCMHTYIHTPIHGHMFAFYGHVCTDTWPKEILLLVKMKEKKLLKIQSLPKMLHAQAIRATT